MSDRKLTTFQRGHIRDSVVLAHYRNALRAQINPDTGILFTEDEVLRATGPGSLFFLWADAQDLLCQAIQGTGLLLADQQLPSRSNTNALNEVHGRLWLGRDSRLPAVGGSGTVDAPATPGTIFVGSPNIGEATAVIGTDPNGYRYQVLSTVTTLDSGIAELTMKGVDTGSNTNPDIGTKITWSANKPLGAEPEATVSNEDFSGGYDAETDSEYATRIEEVISHRPAVGNAAHFVAWAKEASVAVEAAFIYSCAFNAGSVIVAITQKRGSSEGPYGRTEVSLGTMSDATAYLVPPNSPVVPRRAYVVVVECAPQDSDIILRLAMGKGTSGGWADLTPWPDPDQLVSSYPVVEVTSVTSQTEFEVESDSDLPGGATILSGTNAPQLMLWNKDSSEFEELSVSSVELTDTDTYTITLNSAPSMTIEDEQRLSPYTDRMDLISGAAENYFDSLGPGEVVDLDTDDRAHRAWRFPKPEENYPIRAGQKVVAWLADALGDTASDISLEEISRSEPDLPSDLIDGPNIVTLGHVALYPL